MPYQTTRTGPCALRGGISVFLYQGNCPRVSSISDKNNWKAVSKALDVIGFTSEEVQLLGVDGSALKEALTHKKLTAKGEEVIVLSGMFLVLHKLANGKTRRIMSREEFRLLHYAGEVNYNVNGFLDKNNDLLNRNLKEVMCQSENQILSHCFRREEVIDQKRPEMV
ncbi:hypothetical protein GOODEAATRI_026085 [Goodea atripinnis]|uniref:Myosin motor domain-containing protein n=1 Tax=Goodea atripinnis TaxID=208336 RepID=A0ABV0PRT2_9TELE